MPITPKDGERRHKCHRCDARFSVNEAMIPERLRHDGALSVCPACVKADIETALASGTAVVGPAELARLRFEAICPREVLEGPTVWSRLPDQVAANKVVGWSFGSRGLLAHGVTGMGKTRAIWSLIERLMEDGHNVVATDAIDLGRDISTRAGGDQDEFRQWLRHLERCEVLYLDDLGKGRVTPVRADATFGIIKHRIEGQRPTLITTNTLGETLEEMFGPDIGPPLRRRLTEDFDGVPFGTQKGEQ